MIAIPLFFSLTLKAQTLYVGRNGHPHDDKGPAKIKKDFMSMKAAGFISVLVQSLKQAGEIWLKAFSKTLKRDELVIKVQ